MRKSPSGAASRIAWILLLCACGGNSGSGSPLAPVSVLMTFRCGEETVRFAVQDGEPSLVAGRERFMLREVRAASGAKYEAVCDATTTFWSKGDRALVSLRGRFFPECTTDGG